MSSVRRSIVRRVLACSVLTASVAASGACDSATTPTTVTSPVTETYSGTFQPGGAASRSFVAAQAGEVKLKLLSTTPVDVIYGLGFGTADADGRNCRITDTVLTGYSVDTPQITKTVTAGTYCVRVNDPGNLVLTNGSFVVTIVRP